MQDLVEQEQQRHRAARRLDDRRGCAGSRRRSASGRPAASPRCGASRRAPAATRAARRADRCARQRQHDVDADRPQQRALPRHVRAADDDHARAGRRRGARRCGRRLPRRSADGRAPSASNTGPSSTSSGNGSVGLLEGVGRQRRQRLDLADGPEPLADRRSVAACQRSIATASCGRSSRTYAIGANIMLCVESTHDTRRLQLRDAARGDDAVGDQRLPQRRQARRGEGLPLDALEQRQQERQIALGRLDRVDARARSGAATATETPRRRRSRAAARWG